jgi:hypothetical protein
MSKTARTHRDPNRGDGADNTAPSLGEGSPKVPGLLWSALAMLGIGLGGILRPSEVHDEHEHWLGIG